MQGVIHSVVAHAFLLATFMVSEASLHLNFHIAVVLWEIDFLRVETAFTTKAMTLGVT